MYMGQPQSFGVKSRGRWRAGGSIYNNMLGCFRRGVSTQPSLEVLPRVHFPLNRLWWVVDLRRG